MHTHPYHIILPGTEQSLLRRELDLALSQLGFKVTQVQPEHLHTPEHHHFLPNLLQQGPALFISINCMGLERLKTSWRLLQEASSQAVIWFVDNPWNVLSSVKEPQWRELPLFVTDASFIPGLLQNGAQKVFHLPLGMSQECMGNDTERQNKFPAPDALAPVVFVGRSEFPGKKDYFEGQTLPPEILAQAIASLSDDTNHDALAYSPTAAGCSPPQARPDFLWWQKELDQATKLSADDNSRSRRGQSLWPGKASRKPAFGAETCSFFWRTSVLNAAAEASQKVLCPSAAAGSTALDIFGDQGWLEDLHPLARLRVPVDYYTRLPQIYAQARYSLSVTSMQLPAGLNQRHFDVWTAGGVCLTDATPGLAIFPEELVRITRFACLQDIAPLLNSLETQCNRATLVADWQNTLLAQHTYKHRMEYLLSMLGW